MTNDIVYGVGKVEIGISKGDLTLPDVIITAHNIEEGSVSYTSNQDTRTSITPEDKDVPVIVLFTPGDADAFNFGLLEFSEENLNLLFNIEYDAATSTTTVLAERKHANLWIRLTTRAQLGVKKIFVFPNTICDVSYKNNFTKNGLVAISVVASILSFPTDSGKDGAYTIQKINADDTIENDTPPTVDAGADQLSVSTSSVTLTGTATAAGSKTIVSTKWTKKSGPAGTTITSPNNLSTTITGVTTGTFVFTLSATDSNGDITTDDVTVTHT